MPVCLTSEVDIKTGNINNVKVIFKHNFASID